mmetsp:Transcript_105967/g.147747  ORF Transcript_105967/g.147747 Transcript_105967/m.147747 type:complete len:89 (+) Transcript_105967:46-312(+)
METQMPKDPADAAWRDRHNKLQQTVAHKSGAVFFLYLMIFSVGLLFTELARVLLIHTPMSYFKRMGSVRGRHEEIELQPAESNPSKQD